MIAWQEMLGLKTRTPEDFPSFEAYLDVQEELFIESMQDTADNQWHKIAKRMPGASEREIGIKMERWWESRICRFRSRLRRAHERDVAKRALRRATIRRIHAEEQREALEIELYQVKGELQAALDFISYMKEQQRCRDCKGELWN